MQTDLTKSPRQLKSEGKLTEGNVRKISKDVRKAIKDRIETRVERVHGGRKPSKANNLDVEMPVWLNGKFISRSDSGRLREDNYLGIDVIFV